MNNRKHMLVNINSVSVGTWLRLALLILSLINAALHMFGIYTMIPSNTQAAEIVSMLITAVSALIAYWKNNSFTDSAQKADQFLWKIREREQFLK